MLSLSIDQKNALASLFDWFRSKNKPQFITLGGYAGTGKTTLISHFRNKLHKNNSKTKVAFISFTGKAARVLESKLSEHKAIYKDDYCGTIHSLIYSPIINDKEEITSWELRSQMKYNLIIVDEASMVDEKIWQDLLSFHIPILAVGDHGQLPPINGKFNLLQNPQLVLRKIHRQASKNPIIKLSIMAREDGEIPFGDFGPHVKKLDRSKSDTGDVVEELLRSYNNETIILCGYNSTRVKLNNFVRILLEFHSTSPQAGDRVICLRNNHTNRLYNGMLGNLTNLTEKNEDHYLAEIDLDGGNDKFQGLIMKSQFNSTQTLSFSAKRRKTLKTDLFDFGYALTVHKAQGSQAQRVILFEERFKQMDDSDWKRWLYTAVTRAEEELYIIS